MQLLAAVTFPYSLLRVSLFHHIPPPSPSLSAHSLINLLQLNTAADAATAVIPAVHQHPQPGARIRPGGRPLTDRSNNSKAVTGSCTQTFPVMSYGECRSMLWMQDVRNPKKINKSRVETRVLHKKMLHRVPSYGSTLSFYII